MRHGFHRKVWWAMNRVERWLLGIALGAMLASLISFRSALRALPDGADIPDRIFAGAIGVPAIPIYLFSAIMATAAVRQLRPVEAAVEVPAAV